jgi:anti-anti-sigma regulatory factor
VPERGFALSILRRGEQLSIGVSGELTPENFQRVKEALEEGCHATPAPLSIDLDMTEIEEVSDEVIVLLVKTAEECADLGVDMRPSFHDVVRRAVDAAGYDEHLRPR